MRRDKKKQAYYKVISSLESVFTACIFYIQKRIDRKIFEKELLKRRIKCGRMVLNFVQWLI